MLPTDTDPPLPAAPGRPGGPTGPVSPLSPLLPFEKKQKQNSTDATLNVHSRKHFKFQPLYDGGYSLRQHINVRRLTVRP